MVTELVPTDDLGKSHLQGMWEQRPVEWQTREKSEQVRRNEGPEFPGYGDKRRQVVGRARYTVEMRTVSQEGIR